MFITNDNKKWTQEILDNEVIMNFYIFVDNRSWIGYFKNEFKKSFQQYILVNEEVLLHKIHQNAVIG